MTDKEKLLKLEKLADAMYYAAQNLTTDASRLHKAMDEYHKFIIYECKEEPVSEPIDFEKELYKAFGQVKDFTLGMRIAKWFYDMGKNGQEPISEDFETALEKKVREAQDWTYIEEEGGECPLNEEFGACDLEEFARWGADWVRNNKKEPVSKDLGEYINELSKQFPEVSFAKLSRIAVRAAKWQKQQMMKDAVVMEAHEEYGELWGDITKCSTEKGKKYKVIILKMEGLL